MVSCCVGDCDVTRRNNPKNYTFHRFPRRPELHAKWTRIVNRPEWIPNKFSTICSKHFEERCFIQRSRLRLLLKDSIPTLFVPIKLKQTWLTPAYVDSDIALLPEELNTSGHSTEIPSTQVLSSREKKLMERNAVLKKKLLVKSRRIRSLVAKTIRMNKQLLILQEVLKDLINIRPDLENHNNELVIE